VRYKLEEKSKCDIGTKRREALKGPILEEPKEASQKQNCEPTKKL
jgi:hypothetical protein